MSTKTPREKLSGKTAAGPGLEPGYIAPGAIVLPLDDPAL